MCCWETNESHRKDKNLTAAGQAQGLRVLSRTLPRHVPRLQQAKGHETRRVHQRVVTDCGLATAEFIPLWKFLWRGGSLWQQTEGTGPSPCDGQTTTGTSQSRGAARSVPSHLGERGAAAGNGDETSSTIGTEDGPSAGPISSRCRIWREGDAGAAKGPREFRGSAAGGDASQDGPGPTHAGSPAAGHASSTSQREHGQNLGSFDGDHRKLVEPRRRSTTRAPDTRNPRVEANPSGPLRLSCLKREAQLWTPISPQDRIPSYGIWKRTKSRRWQTSRRHMLPGGPPVEATVSRARKAATGNAPRTPPPKQTRTAAPADAAQGGAPVLAGPKVVSVRSSQHWQSS